MCGSAKWGRAAWEGTWPRGSPHGSPRAGGGGQLDAAQSHRAGEAGPGRLLSPGGSAPVCLPGPQSCPAECGDDPCLAVASSADTWTYVSLRPTGALGTPRPSSLTGEVVEGMTARDGTQGPLVPAPRAGPLSVSAEPMPLPSSSCVGLHVTGSKPVAVHPAPGPALLPGQAWLQHAHGLGGRPLPSLQLLGG